MGLSLFSKCSCTCVSPANTQPKCNDVDLSSYSVLNAILVNSSTILLVKYHNATNYEGVKILVFEGAAPSFLDPHFCEHHKSPIARFEPTERGWNLALKFAEMLYTNPLCGGRKGERD